MNGSATVVITLALAFYSIGAWSERLQGRLRPWHLAFFWLGLVCDTVGTGMMLDFAGRLTADVHGISGVLAILLMAVHAVWAAEPIGPRRMLPNASGPIGPTGAGWPAIAGGPSPGIPLPGGVRWAC